jgi:hypothetical protein
MAKNDPQKYKNKIKKFHVLKVLDPGGFLCSLDSFHEGDDFIKRNFFNYKILPFLVIKSLDPH